MFKKIFTLLFGEKSEIQRVEAALRKYKHQLWELEADFDSAKDCCVTCMTGGLDIKLSDKIERVEKWLEILKNRKMK
jgi:hypothetical protein